MRGGEAGNSVNTKSVKDVDGEVQFGLHASSTIQYQIQTVSIIVNTGKGRHWWATLGGDTIRFAFGAQAQAAAS